MLQALCCDEYVLRRDTSTALVECLDRSLIGPVLHHLLLMLDLVVDVWCLAHSNVVMVCLQYVCLQASEIMWTCAGIRTQ